MNTYQEVKKHAFPFIESYQDDLVVHDKRCIEENPGVPFLHFTGKTGTYLERLVDADAYPTGSFKYIFGWSTREELLDAIVPITNSMKTRYGRGDLALYYDGKFVKEISHKKATEIATDYVEKIRRAWGASDD